MARKLLLADDSVTIQKVVGISFASEDVELITVDNGDDAVLRVRELRPDAVLADVVMPGKSGYEVCEELHADPELSQIPVLLLTGAFEAFDEERATRCGAAGHIAKPFEAHVLVERVKELFAAPRPSAPPPPVPAEPASPRVEIGRVEPVTAAAPPPNLDDSGSSFDFFDDTASTVAVPETDPLDLSFAFGDDDAPSVPQRELVPPPVTNPESTVALDAISVDDLEDLPSEEPAVTRIDPAFPAPSSSDGDDLLTEIVPPPDDDFDFELAPATPAENAQDPVLQDLDDDDVTRLAGDDLERATVLDPLGASGFDVSSSDLAEPVAPPQPAADATDPRPAPAPERPAEPSAAQHGTHDAAALAGVTLAEIEPRLREELHDTLEKIAWESLGDVSEQIVRQAVERIEQVAWEVVPQLAETLIREEIRRMKGES